MTRPSILSLRMLLFSRDRYESGRGADAGEREAALDGRMLGEQCLSALVQG